MGEWGASKMGLWRSCTGLHFLLLDLLVSERTPRARRIAAASTERAEGRGGRYARQQDAADRLRPESPAWDLLRLHPDLPPTQSVHYLLVVVFLRGNTNPPPDDWFYRIETWNKKVRAEGATVTVPEEAQQAILFLAPETGGDFSTLRSAVRGRPGIFVRASQDLAEAGFEQARSRSTWPRSSRCRPRIRRDCRSTRTCWRGR